jgi:hypothetical protein
MVLHKHTSTRCKYIYYFWKSSQQYTKKRLSNKAHSRYALLDSLNYGVLLLQHYTIGMEEPQHCELKQEPPPLHAQE